MRRSALLLIVLASVVVIAALVLVIGIRGTRGGTPHIVLRYHDPNEHAESRVADRVTLTESDTALNVTVYIPHINLPLTSYNVSLVTPSTRHLTLPSLRRSRKSQAGVDTLDITLDHTYLAEAPGSYTLVLTEIFFEDPTAGQQPAIYLYPFSIDVH